MSKSVQLTINKVKYRGLPGHSAGSIQYQSLGTLRSGRRFTLLEIKGATNNFDESLVIGVGGLGKVFKAELDDATKRANPQSQQGPKEFDSNK
ncbi:hypothetical protein KY284_033325 [Solanum tuberosum]|nr:hypothetical protein KY284_033325 [Solanum tuberosum]